MADEVPKSMTEFLGVTGRQMVIGKHHASNWHHIKALIERLDASGSQQDKEVADTLVWMCWWRDFDRMQYERMQGEIDALKSNQE